jgi:hypothetical protein
VQKLGSQNGLARLQEIRDWPQGFATCPASGQLSFQRVIVPLLRLLTKDAVRLSNCGCLCLCQQFVWRSTTMLSVCLSVHLSAFLPRKSRTVLACLSVCLSFCPSVCLSVCLNICLSVCLSVRLPVCLSMYLSVCRSVFCLTGHR